MSAVWLGIASKLYDAVVVYTRYTFLTRSQKATIQALSVYCALKDRGYCICSWSRLPTRSASALTALQ